MSSKSKLKGSNYEREIVSMAKEAGLEAERAYASNGKALGEAETVDVVVEGIRIQAKRRKKIADFLCIPEGADAVVFRQDRGDNMVLIDMAMFLDLIKHKKNSTNM